MSDNYNVAVGGTVGRPADDGLVPLVSDLLDQSVQALGDIFGAPDFKLVCKRKGNRAY